MSRATHIYIVDAQHIQSDGGHHAGQGTQTLRLIIQHSVIKEEGAAGITALDVTICIVPAVDHTQGVFRLLGVIAGQLFAAMQSHQHTVSAIEHTGFTAGYHHGFAVGFNGEGFARALGTELEGHVGCDNGQSMGQFIPGNLRRTGEVGRNVILQEGEPITECITHGSQPPVCFFVIIA